MTNKRYERGVALALPVASSVLSGDPLLFGGTMPAVASTDYSATMKCVDGSTGGASLDMEGVFALSVKGANDGGNVAVAVGDLVYFVSGDTPVLSKKSSGSPFGVALEIVTSGSTTTILVKLLVSGSGPAQKPFVSAEQTGTGAAQNVAHGLGVKPSAVFIAPTDLTPATVGSYAVTEGTHTSTNVVVTVTTSKKFKVIAWI